MRYFFPNHRIYRRDHIKPRKYSVQNLKAFRLVWSVTPGPGGFETHKIATLHRMKISIRKRPSAMGVTCGQISADVIQPETKSQM